MGEVSSARCSRSSAGTGGLHTGAIRITLTYCNVETRVGTLLSAAEACREIRCSGGGSDRVREGAVVTECQGFCRRSRNPIYSKAAVGTVASGWQGL
jgi:hypothetical protein